MCEVYTDKCTCPDCPDAYRDLEKDLNVCRKATPGPWKVLMASCDCEYPCSHKPFAGGLEHMNYGELPEDDWIFIAEARKGWPVAIRRALKAEKKNFHLLEALDGAEKRVKHFEGEFSDAEEAIEALNATIEVKDEVIADLCNQLAGTGRDVERLEEENGRLREALEYTVKWMERGPQLSAPLYIDTRREVFNRIRKALGDQ